MSPRMRTDIYGHMAECQVLAYHGMGTYDVEVERCDAMPDLAGKCFRVSGLWPPNQPTQPQQGD